MPVSLDILSDERVSSHGKRDEYMVLPQAIQAELRGIWVCENHPLASIKQSGEGG